MTGQQAPLLQESGAYADLQEFAYEVAVASGLLGVSFELDSGESANLGDSLEELFGEKQASGVRKALLSILGPGQDALSMVWADLHVLCYRVGRCATLWVLCNSAHGEDKVREIWTSRRGPWALRLEGPDSDAEQPVAVEEEQWRVELEPRIRELLRETESLFVSLRAGEINGGSAQAHQEFASLAAGWASFCDPSVVSMPMLLDSLRQCLSAHGEGRAQFFERMQELMGDGP